MIREIARFVIKPDEGNAFAAAVLSCKPIFAASKGFIRLSFERTVEDENLFFLLIDWETLEDHTVAFRNSEKFSQWRQSVGKYFAEPPQVFHTQIIGTNP